MAENNNFINVGGRLHSIATGNVLTGANEILDDNKNKKQSEINAEMDASLADRYTKAETYNKTELNNMITTPNQQYVSVTANSQTTAVTDVLPATGEANTVYRVGNWDGTQYDTTVYSEYSWNGTNYVFLSKKEDSGDDIFDVSAKYPTSGVEGGNTYTLEGALAVLNTNLPSNKKKGGMSIKFIQSSDNKYMQYFLTKDEWSASVDDWEKMNLEDELTKLEARLDNVENILNSEFTTDYLLSDNGALVNGYSSYRALFDKQVGGTYYPKYIPVNEGDIVSYTGFVIGTACAIVGYDSNKSNPSVLLNDITANASDFIDEKITIPSGIAYICSCGRTSATGSYSGDRDTSLSINHGDKFATKSELNEVQNQINNFENIYATKSELSEVSIKTDLITNKDYSSNFTDGYYSNGSITIGDTASDTVQSADNYKHMRIDAIKGFKYHVTGSVGSIKLYVLTDTNKVVKEVGSSSGTYDIIPNENGYIYINALTANNKSVIRIGLKNDIEAIDRFLSGFESTDYSSSFIDESYFSIGTNETETQISPSSYSGCPTSAQRIAVSNGDTFYIEGVGGGTTPRMFALTKSDDVIYLRADEDQEGAFIITAEYDGHLYLNLLTAKNKRVIKVKEQSERLIKVDRLWDSMNSFIKGKKIACIGDSITYGYDGNPAPSHLISYPYILSQNGAIVTNLGVSLSHWAGDSNNAFWKRFDQVPNDADIIIIMGLTNDWIYPNGIPMGDMSSSADTPAQSIYSALKYSAEYFLSNRPTAKLLFMTPIKCTNTFQDQGTFVDGKNSIGLTLRDYADAIVNVGQYYGISILDLNAECGINPLINASKTAYYLTDGIHPNNAGNKRLFTKILKKIGEL